jgi:hypothetical protein
MENPLKSFLFYSAIRILARPVWQVFQVILARSVKKLRATSARSAQGASASVRADTFTFIGMAPLSEHPGPE